MSATWAAIGCRIAAAWGLAAGGQLVLWLVQQRTRNAGIVDVGWAFAFAAVAALFAATAMTPATTWLPLAIVVSAWSLRLGGYLVARGAARSPEDRRYADLRARWAPHAARRFFVFFQAQAALVGVLATALVVPFVCTPAADRACLRYVGASISALAILGEAIADAQLARWKRDPAHKGCVCDVGLWGYSRHPNYFFEWCVWLGYAITRSGFRPYGALADRSASVAVALDLVRHGHSTDGETVARVARRPVPRVPGSACRSSFRARRSARNRRPVSGQIFRSTPECEAPRDEALPDVMRGAATKQSAMDRAAARSLSLGRGTSGRVTMKW